MIPLFSFFTWRKIKTLIIVLLIGAAIWIFKDWRYQIKEVDRVKENATQLRKFDSIKFASQTYSKRELDEYLEYQRKDLQQYLNDNKIKTNRIERIITQKLNYLDTASRKQDLSPILEAIKQNKQGRVAVVDSTDCLIVKGWVVFENDSLSLDVTERKFTNITDVVSYWERNKWSFLGIKTRLFGRKKATVIIKDKCGISRTIVIDKRK